MASSLFSYEIFVSHGCTGLSQKVMALPSCNIILLLLPGGMVDVAAVGRRLRFIWHMTNLWNSLRYLNS